MNQLECNLYSKVKLLWRWNLDIFTAALKAICVRIWNMMEHYRVHYDQVISDTAHECTSLPLRQNNEFISNMHPPFHKRKWRPLPLGNLLQVSDGGQYLEVFLPITSRCSGKLRNIQRMNYIHALLRFPKSEWGHKGSTFPTTPYGEQSMCLY